MPPSTLLSETEFRESYSMALALRLALPTEVLIRENGCLYLSDSSNSMPSCNTDYIIVVALTTRYRRKAELRREKIVQPSK